MNAISLVGAYEHVHRHTICCIADNDIALTLYSLLSMASLSSLTFLWLADCRKMPRVTGPSVYNWMSISY